MYIFKLFVSLYLCILLLTGITFVEGYQISGKFTNTEGSIVSFNSYDGSMLLIDATATWCTSCDAQLQNLQIVYDKGSNVNILTLSIDTADTIPKIVDLKGKFSSPWNFGLDHDANFNDQYPVSVLPTLYLFNAEGIVVKKWEGIISSTDIIDELNNNGEEISIQDISGDDSAISKDPGSLLSDLVNNPIFKMILIIGIVGFLFSKSVSNPKKNIADNEKVSN